VGFVAAATDLNPWSNACTGDFDTTGFQPVVRRTLIGPGENWQEFFQCLAGVK